VHTQNVKKLYAPYSKVQTVWDIDFIVDDVLENIDSTIMTITGNTSDSESDP